MSNLSDYIKKSVTMLQDKSETSWNATIKRLSIEWKRIDEDMKNLNENGVYILNEDNFACFKVMIFKEDAGPYKYTPFCFEILPCRDETGLMYPMCPPIVKFRPFSKYWIHPNLKVTGDVCISPLSYSYVGPGQAIWNPMMGIKSIATILSSIIDRGALKMEPSFSDFSLTHVSVINYDKVAQFICMKHIIELYKDNYKTVEEFKHILKEYIDKMIEYVMTVCNENIGQKMSISTYAFNDYFLDYDELFDKAIEVSVESQQSK